MDSLTEIYNPFPGTERVTIPVISEILLLAMAICTHAMHTTRTTSRYAIVHKASGIKLVCQALLPLLSTRHKAHHNTAKQEDGQEQTHCPSPRIKSKHATTSIEISLATTSMSSQLTRSTHMPSEGGPHHTI